MKLKTWTIICLFFLAWKLTVFAAIFFGFTHLVFLPKFSLYVESTASGLPEVFRLMSNFDGQHYLAIAHHGYEDLTQAFFPLYPLLIHILAKLVSIPFIVSGLIISHFCFLLSLYVSCELFLFDTKKKYTKSSLFLFLAVIVFFPTAQFYGAVYNDSLFLLFATLTLYFARTRNWFVASIFGGLTTLTRLNGLALWPFLVVEYLSSVHAGKYAWRPQWWWKKRNILFRLLFRWPFWASLLIPLSFMGYLFFHHMHFGSWMVVFRNMEVWNQSKVTLPPQVFWRYMKILITTPQNHYQYWVAFLELSAVLFYMGTLIYSWRKIRLSYWLFIAFSILIPWLTGSFQGMPRYGLHLYPLFLIITMFLTRAPYWVRIFYFLISLGLFFFYTAFFTSGYFVA
jgi:hypothetical protein